MALWGVANPACQSLMSRRLGAAEQGRLQGAIASLMGVANLIGPGLFTATFALFIGTARGLGLPGAPFLLAAVLLAAAIVTALEIAESYSGSRNDLSLREGKS